MTRKRREGSNGKRKPYNIEPAVLVTIDDCQGSGDLHAPAKKPWKMLMNTSDPELLLHKGIFIIN